MRYFKHYHDEISIAAHAENIYLFRVFNKGKKSILHAKYVIKTIFRNSLMTRYIKGTTEALLSSHVKQLSMSSAISKTAVNTAHFVLPQSTDEELKIHNISTSLTLKETFIHSSEQSCTKSMIFKCYFLRNAHNTEVTSPMKHTSLSFGNNFSRRCLNQYILLILEAEQQKTHYQMFSLAFYE